MDPAADRQRFLETNRASWDKIAAQYKGRTALPLYGPLAPSEEELGLLGDVRGLNVVEIGCGSGHSLAYLHARGAGELYGLDLSPAQIRTAEQTAGEHGFSPRLFCCPMEDDPGIPAGHFDLAISIYALGWSVDLAATLGHIVRYLRPGGVLVFSWEHPVYSCLKTTPKGIVLDRSYSEEGPVEKLSWKGEPIVMHARKVSTLLNAVIDAGFTVERVNEGDLREQGTEQADFPHRWYSKARARMMPTTLIVKARRAAAASCGSTMSR